MSVLTWSPARMQKLPLQPTFLHVLRTDSAYGGLRMQAYPALFPVVGCERGEASISSSDGASRNTEYVMHRPRLSTVRASSLSLSLSLCAVAQCGPARACVLRGLSTTQRSSPCVADLHCPPPCPLFFCCLFVCLCLSPSSNSTTRWFLVSRSRKHRKEDACGRIDMT